MIFIVYKFEYIYIKNAFTKNNVSYRTIFIIFFFINKIISLRPITNTAFIIHQL